MSERKVIGRLNPYWAKLMQGLAMHYKYPFMDIKEISINTETEEISVIEKDIVMRTDIPDVPMRVYWRRKKGEKLSYDDADNMEAAQRMWDELAEAGYIDIQMIVKGKKSEVTKC